jgi:hypothetical protein
MSRIDPKSAKGDVGQELPRGTRDRHGRMIARAMREGWAPSTARLEELRKQVEDVVMTSQDDRAKVLAYRALLESEVAIVNSINQIAGLENSQAEATDPTPEPDDPE